MQPADHETLDELALPDGRAEAIEGRRVRRPGRELGQIRADAAVKATRQPATMTPHVVRSGDDERVVGAGGGDEARDMKLVDDGGRVWQVRAATNSDVHAAATVKTPPLRRRTVVENAMKARVSNGPARLLPRSAATV